jgi:hypothetical protein
MSTHTLWLSEAAERLTHRKYVNFRKKIVRSSPASYNEATAEKVWRIGAALTGLEQKNLSH